MKEQWSNKVFQKETPQDTAEANAAALAQLELLDNLMNLDEIDIEEAFKDE